MATKNNAESKVGYDKLWFSDDGSIKAPWDTPENKPLIWLRDRDEFIPWTPEIGTQLYAKNINDYELYYIVPNNEQFENLLTRTFHLSEKNNEPVVSIIYSNADSNVTTAITIKVSNLITTYVTEMASALQFAAKKPDFVVKNIDFLTWDIDNVKDYPALHLKNKSGGRKKKYKRRTNKLNYRKRKRNNTTCKRKTKSYRKKKRNRCRKQRKIRKKTR